MESLTMENSSKCGCNSTATKRISKTASITSISKTQRATRFNVWSSIKLMAVVFIMTQLLSIGQADAMTLRPRQMRKRHSNSVDPASRWNNPCGGEWIESNSTHVIADKDVLRNLRHTTRIVLREINVNVNKGINISGFYNEWELHIPKYKFLPKLRNNSTIALRRWHRNMQTFVGAFTYLHLQRDYDMKFSNKERSISRELHEQIQNAQHILCEIESAINRTTPHSREKKFTSFSQESMFKRLRFPKELEIVNPNFTKYYFVKFLRTMWMIMRKKRVSQSNSISSNSISDTSSASGSVYSNESDTSQKRPSRKHSPNKPRQRLHRKNSSLAIA